MSPSPKSHFGKPINRALQTMSTKPVNLCSLPPNSSRMSVQLLLTELLRKAKPLLKPGGLLWATYPKAGQMGTDLKREAVWECAAAEDLDTVAQIAVDDVWSALRLKQV